MTFRAGLFGLLLLTSTMPLGAGQQLSMRVFPSFAFAPANLVIRAMVVADAENRAVRIVAESEDFYRSSEIQLDGDRAPRTSQFEFRSLPQGTYEVKAMLFGQSGDMRALVRQQVSVIAIGSGR